MVDVLHAQVHAARARGLGQAVVGVVLVMREDGLPLLDEALGNRLGADVHEAPLVELVILKLDGALLDGKEDVLGPRHKQPHDGAVLRADGVEDGLGGHATQEHALAAADEATQPVHCGTGVIERRDAQKHVVVGLPVVLLLHLRRLREALMVVQDGLGEAGGAAREVDGGILVLRDRHKGVGAGHVGGELVVALGKRRAVAADIEKQAVLGNARLDLLDAAGELRAEDKDVDVGQIDAVLNLLGGIAEVERDHRCAALKHAEENGQVLEAVHEKDCDLVALLYATAQKQVGKAIRLLVEDAPGNLPAVRLHAGALDEAVVAPRRVVELLNLRVDLDKGDLVCIVMGVAPQEVGNRHCEPHIIEGTRCA